MKNIRYYIQGCVSATFTIVTVATFNCAYGYTRTRLQKSIATVLYWEIVHMSSGIVLIIFNKSICSKFTLKSLLLFTRTPTA
ncbi:hypothetical protein OESDEN_04728 [Oesophagostomum dentatum]|uniref:7TM GPCR serpentine receptor class x (Srx) domain-containing protein n=1 Tax=Oesophagostomum dentatum TaxID=61180 RepID=A0A0B1TGU3_OESDE|nr:hypothetical protein OESDEN_04728 [Oesophagostomum dentatum]